MATNKIHLTNTFGQTVKFTKDTIESALIGRNAGVPEHWGEAFVWAEDPTMVGIAKLRSTKRGPFYYEITENDDSNRPSTCRCGCNALTELVRIKFTEDELDMAIKIFMELCEKPKKIFQRALIKKAGGHAIFLKGTTAKGTTG